LFFAPQEDRNLPEDDDDEEEEDDRRSHCSSDSDGGIVVDRPSNVKAQTTKADKGRSKK
jgi:hypothetical protein